MRGRTSERTAVPDSTVAVCHAYSRESHSAGRQSREALPPALPQSRGAGFVAAHSIGGRERLTREARPHRRRSCPRWASSNPVCLSRPTGCPLGAPCAPRLLNKRAKLNKNCCPFWGGVANLSPVSRILKRLSNASPCPDMVPAEEGGGRFSSDAN